jgi:cytochrome P450
LETQNIPIHVPSELVREFDFKKEIVGVKDSYRELSKLHEGPDIFFTPSQGGHWVVTRFTDMEAIFKNAAQFSSRNALIPKGARPMNILPLESDAPLHTDYRQILYPFFTIEAVRAMEKGVEELTAILIEEMYAKGRCEFMTDFALKMPIKLFMRLVDLPDSDVPYLLSLADGFFHGETPERQFASTAEMIGYVQKKLLERKESLRNDLLSAVLKGKVEGGRSLTENEIIGMATVLVLGGLDTVASMLGWIAQFLATSDSHRRQLVQSPELIPKALEELLRRHHIGCLAREVKEDMTYKGIVMKAGDMVLLPTVVAGLDETQFTDPFTVDFSRKDSKHLVFGRGPHTCIGAFLGRTELRIFIAEWLKRIPEFSIVPGSESKYIMGLTHSLESLHLRWDPK